MHKVVETVRSLYMGKGGQHTPPYQGNFPNRADRPEVRNEQCPGDWGASLSAMIGRYGNRRASEDPSDAKINPLGFTVQGQYSTDCDTDEGMIDGKGQGLDRWVG